MSSSGIILLIGLGVIATYTGYVLGQFKLRYPQVHTFAEAGGIIAGRWGYEICAIAQLLFLGKLSHSLWSRSMANLV